MTTSTTTNEMVQQLTQAFLDAKAAAEVAGVNAEDGGSCNFDTPAFRFDGGKKSLIVKAAAAAGVEVSQFHWLGGRRWWWLNLPFKGMANRRSRMSDAADKVLRKAAETLPGMHVCEYQQAD